MQQEAKRRRISVVVPTYNEQDNVLPLAVAVIAELEGKLPQYDYELLFIDNCSTDHTRERLAQLCAENAHVRAIFNAQNFGQFRSPYHGLCQCTGDCAVLLCADFQDPPSLIPTLVSEWEKGYRVVCAVKTKSRENPFMRLLRTCYYKLLRRMSAVEQIEHFTGFGLYDRSFLEVLKGLDDPTPYLRGIVAELGYPRTVVPYTQQKRRAGKTSNSFGTLYDAAMQSFAAYTKAPVRAMMLIGVLLLLASLCGGIAALVLALQGRVLPILTLAAVIGLFGSLQLIFLSLLGEYLLFLRSKTVKRPIVVEEKRLNFDKKEG